MTDFKPFLHKSTGVVDYLPADSAEHPVYGYDLVPYDDSVDEYEEDKVVQETHEIPVEQRVQKTAKLKDLHTVDTNRGTELKTTDINEKVA